MLRDADAAKSLKFSHNRLFHLIHVILKNKNFSIFFIKQSLFFKLSTNNNFVIFDRKKNFLTRNRTPIQLQLYF